MLHLLGLDHKKLTYYHNGIQRRLTDVHGEVDREDSGVSTSAVVGGATMSEPSVCSRGHHWSEEDASTSPQETLQVCPVCGLPAQAASDTTLASSPDAVVGPTARTRSDSPSAGLPPDDPDGTLMPVVSQQAETIAPTGEPPAGDFAQTGREASATFRHNSASVQPLSAAHGGPVWRDIPGYEYPRHARPRRHGRRLQGPATGASTAWWP